MKIIFLFTWNMCLELDRKNLISGIVSCFLHLHTFFWVNFEMTNSFDLHSVRRNFHLFNCSGVFTIITQKNVRTIWKILFWTNPEKTVKKSTRWIFIGKSFIFSVNYDSFLLRKHHFLLHEMTTMEWEQSTSKGCFWLLPDDSKTASVATPSCELEIFSLRFPREKTKFFFVSFKFALFLDRSINHGRRRERVGGEKNYCKRKQHRNEKLELSWEREKATIKVK